MNPNNLANYTALIQLISAVNFAYIFTRFHQKVYELIFNEKELIENKFTSFINDMTVDVESLQSMEPIETTKGTNNSQSLEKLNHDFAELDEEWNNKKQNMLDTLQRVRNVNGMRSLFLYVSLFCIVDIFNIATIQWFPRKSFLTYMAVFNIISVGVSLFLSYVIIASRWKNKLEVNCYKWTSKVFAITLFVSLASPWIVIWICSQNPFVLVPEITYTLAVAIPFYACVFSVIYVWGYELIFKYLAGINTKDVRNKQIELHRQKMTFDASYKMFSSDPPSFE